MSAPVVPPLELETHEVRVLLVDDQLIVGKMVEAMLASHPNTRFRFCQDPRRAIREAEEFGPTVILQDLVMPDVDGMVLVKFFRHHPRLRDVPLIVLSSNEEAVTKADAFAAGANDYLVKLPDRVELLARVRYHSRAYVSLVQRNQAYDALLKSEAALAAELSRAAEYVVSLLPKPIETGDIRTQWWFTPSARLGGDSFGYHCLDSGHFAVYLLDVCDHGVGSALLSVSALNAIRSESLPGADFSAPESVLAALNRAFPMESHNGLNFTIWYGVVDRSTHRIRFASAGHPPALLFSGPAEEPRELQARNLFIGAMPDTAYTAREADLCRPATLYVFSDGAYEITRPDGSLWSLREFADFIRETRRSGTDDLAGLYAHVRRVGGDRGLDDDFSVVRIDFPT